MNSRLIQNRSLSVVSKAAGRLLRYMTHTAKYILDKRYRELSRIQRFPRFTSFKTNILGPQQITAIDNASFLSSYNELFTKCNYSFRATTNAPLIIDCGSNIGLSIIYFKTIYPNAKIIGFEPDEYIFHVLESNIKSFKLNDVSLHNACCWNEETNLNFITNKADGGRIQSLNSSGTSTSKVKAIRLRDFLNDKVEFLKIDIEGAETIVLKDCADLLKNVQHLFVEYHSFSDKPQTFHELLTIINNAGFRIYTLGCEYTYEQFIRRNKNEAMDFQVNIIGIRT